PVVFEPLAERGLDDAEVHHAADVVQRAARLQLRCAEETALCGRRAVVRRAHEMDAVVVPVEMGALGLVAVDAVSAADVMVTGDGMAHLSRLLRSCAFGGTADARTSGTLRRPRAVRERWLR